MLSQTKTISELVDKLGDVAHKHYSGCSNENGKDLYSYDNEVINILSTEESVFAIESLFTHLANEVEKLLKNNSDYNKGVQDAINIINNFKKK
jgi:hypothetical protein